MAITLQEGIRLLQEGDLDAAQEQFLGILEAQPTDAPAWLWLANCHVLQGHLRVARRAFRKVIEHGDEEMREEARRQLRSLWYNRFVYHLILNPPLRVILLAAVVGYMISLGLLQASPWKRAAEIVGLISIWVLLPIFFAWCIFIFAYFVGNIAFAPGAKMSDGGVKSARLAIALAGIFVIPANLFVRVGLGVQVLAVFLDVFLLSLLFSQVINSIGRRMAGEESVLILYQMARSGNDASSHDANEPTGKVKEQEQAG